MLIIIKSLIFQANAQCKKYVQGKKYEGFKINAHADNFTYETERKTHEYETDLLRRAKGKKLSKTPELQELKSEYLFLAKHMVKRSYYLQFAKCRDKLCIHCNSYPVTATGFMEDLKVLGGSIPPPSESLIHRKCTLFNASYKNLEEMFTEARTHNLQNVEASQPSFKRGYLKRCPAGCNIILTSTDDMKRHFNLMDHDIAQPKMNKRPRVVKERIIT